MGESFEFLVYHSPFVGHILIVIIFSQSLNTLLLFLGITHFLEDFVLEALANAL